MTGTPLMVRWPALLAPGERTTPVESLDIVPTIAEMGASRLKSGGRAGR